MCLKVAEQQGGWKNYVKKHCHSWYALAVANRIEVAFGDIILVSECSQTASWASAIYSRSCREFGVSFSVGKGFITCSPGAGHAAGQEIVGPLEVRRRQKPPGPIPVDLSKDQTVFIRAYYAGLREMYYGPIAVTIKKARKFLPGAQDQDSVQGTSSTSPSSGDPQIPSHALYDSQPPDSDSILVTTLSPELPVSIRLANQILLHILTCRCVCRTSILRSLCSHMKWRSVINVKALC